MDIEFSSDLSHQATAPVAGRLYLVPRDPAERGRRDLAMLATERGADAFVIGEGTTTTCVVQADPTLDDMLAVLILKMRARGESLMSIVTSYAQYTALCREGLRPSDIPLQQSLEGMFLALRKNCPDDLSAPEATAAFLKHWPVMERALEDAIRRGLDPFSLPLFDGQVEFARQRAFLSHDLEVYRQDVASGERWRVAIPGGPPQSSALILREPKSALWKYWARTDRTAPCGGTYLLLGVRRGKGNWVFSTDPVQRLSLLPLVEAMQRAESAAAGHAAEPRTWFDGQPMGHTLIAAPRGGTRLSDQEVLRVLQQWAAGARVNGGHERLWTWGAAAALAATLLIAVGFWLLNMKRTTTALPTAVE